MPKPRKSSLETPTARLRLPVQKKPHWLRLGPGLSLGYRRNEGPGTWSIRASDGHGGEWLKKFGVADDFEPADGKHILSYSHAIGAARRLVRDGDVEDQTKPVTLAAALAAYEDDLKARGANGYNARAPLRHLPPVLLSKPVPLFAAHELRKWRDGLLAHMTPASVNRLIGNVSAALNFTASHDHRIKSRQAWEVGLQSLPDACQARNVILSDDQVRRLVEAAYERSEALGLYVDVLALTGARPSQAARLTVADLIISAEPKLTAPRSGKGGGRNRARKKVERVSVPITPGLAHRLKVAAADRPADAPLLVTPRGGAWGGKSLKPSLDYRADFRAIVAAIGLDPRIVTIYALRHSSVVRQLLANVPIRVVASLHDTSVTQVESNYSRHITEFSDQLARRALFDLDEPPVANVLALRR
jgi:integrase